MTNDSSDTVAGLLALVASLIAAIVSFLLVYEANVQSNPFYGILSTLIGVVSLLLLAFGILKILGK